MAQIGYVMVGTNDLTRAAVFYDAFLGELGAIRFLAPLAEQLLPPGGRLGW